MKFLKKILSRLRGLFRRKKTTTVQVVSSTYLKSLYGTVVTKPAPHFFMVCHRPGEGETVSIVRAPNSMTLFP